MGFEIKIKLIDLAVILFYLNVLHFNTKLPYCNCLFISVRFRPCDTLSISSIL